MDRFLQELMKHSLITLGTTDADIPVISIHRSTWEMMHSYLKNTLLLKPDHPMVRDVIRRMADYVYEAIDKENRIMQKVLLPHGLLIAKSKLLTADEQMKVKGMVGCLYASVFKAHAAQELLEESIKYIELNMSRDRARLARLYYHLGLAYMYGAKYESAIEYLSRASTVYNQVKNSVGFVQARAHLAGVYYISGNFN